MLLTKLRDYQQEAVKKAEPHAGFAFFMEQRTGKTLCSIALVDKRKPDYLLIVCPKKAIPVWVAELKKHLSITWEMKVEVINFEQAVSKRYDYYKRVKNLPENSMIVCDESHRIKNRGSGASRVLRRLALSFKWRLALTGTPISPRKLTRGKGRNKRSYVVEGLQDLWAQFDFINPRIFGEYTVREGRGKNAEVVDGFELRFCIKGGFKKHQIVGYRNRRLFQKIMQKFSFRKTLNEVRKVKLQSRRVKRYCDLGSKTRSIYETLERDLEVMVNHRNIAVPIVLSLTMKLQQLTGGYIIDTEDGTVISVGKEKLTSLKNLIDTKPFNDKWVIIARFTHEIEAIIQICEKKGLKTIAINGKNDYDLHKCQESDIIVLQIASGVGIDLSMASTTVYYSWDYSFINHEQSRFRMISYDKEKVTRYFLIARDTVDELIYDSIIKKKDLASMICDRYQRRKS